MLENGLSVWFSVDGNSELRAVRLRARGRQGVFDLKRAASSRAEEREICERFDGSLEQLLNIIDSEVELIRQRAAASGLARRLPVNDRNARPQSKIVGGISHMHVECSLNLPLLRGDGPYPASSHRQIQPLLSDRLAFHASIAWA